MGVWVRDEACEAARVLRVWERLWREFCGLGGGLEGPVYGAARCVQSMEAAEAAYTRLRQ